MYKIIFMTQAQKDAKKLASSGLKPKVLQLIKIIESRDTWETQVLQP